MQYISTRGYNEKILSSEAIIKGISDDKGLFIPLFIPKLKQSIKDICSLDYKSLALLILKNYLTDYNENELSSNIYEAYTNTFDTVDIAPLIKKDDKYFLELYHGPTLAFKDMALCLFPHLLKTALKKNNITKEMIILTATSGDTGKASLEGFKNIPGIKVIVFFPELGTSSIQKLQMTTQEGTNNTVIALKGNFDDAQTAVKNIFNNKNLRKSLFDKGKIFSSANSINIGRFLPQIVYYFYAYKQMLNKNYILPDEKINVVVPTGNFGNILSAYYAKEMGLPINKFICASNENNVLSNFFNTGIYDIRKKLKTTSSPSMDILVSSNLERLLYHISGNDYELINSLMTGLNDNKKYAIPNTLKENLNDFYGGYATNIDTIKSIEKTFVNSNYLIDPHTAVATHVYDIYKKSTKDNTKTIIISTASPYKFPKDICKALNIPYIDDFYNIHEISRKTNVPIPYNIENLNSKPILHKDTCEILDIENIVKRILKVGE